MPKFSDASPQEQSRYASLQNHCRTILLVIEGLFVTEFTWISGLERIDNKIVAHKPWGGLYLYVGSYRWLFVMKLCTFFLHVD